MKIALIIPKSNLANKPSFYDYSFYKSLLFTNRYFSYLLAAPVLASLTPPEHEVRIFDENIEDIDYGWSADLAGITVRTMYAKRAYKISQNYRDRGTKTVLGGIHASKCVDEALEYCDSVVEGEAEHIWGKLIEDLKNGDLKKLYQADRKTNLKNHPNPDRSKLTNSRYFADIVQTTKGCPFDCEFCSVSVYDGQKLRHKSVSQVVSEIINIQGTKNQFKKKSIFFADDNIIADRAYALELFKALIPYNLNWSCQGSINISRDGEMLALMKQAGCGAILLGLESVSDKNLKTMGKGVNLRHDYVKAITAIQDHGIMVQGSFVLGYDDDTRESFDELIDFINNANILMPLINILTPFPGTRLFKRFETEKRILHKDWDDYDGQTVVFKPVKISPDELYEGFRKVLREVYSFESIYCKLNKFWEVDFWKKSNELDPVKFRYRILFALRLLSLLPTSDIVRTKFILRIIPKIFNKKTRISTIITLMAYNDYAYKT